MDVVDFQQTLTITPFQNVTEFVVICFLISRLVNISPRLSPPVLAIDLNGPKRSGYQTTTHKKLYQINVAVHIIDIENRPININYENGHGRTAFTLVILIFKMIIH